MSTTPFPESYSNEAQRPSGRHPVNVGHLVMGIAFLGLVGVWALIQTDVVGGGDVRWLLPVPWVLAGLAGLLALSLSSRHKWSTRQVGWVETPNTYPAAEPAVTPTYEPGYEAAYEPGSTEPAEAGDRTENPDPTETPDNAETPDNPETPNTPESPEEKR